MHRLFKVASVLLQVIALVDVPALLSLWLVSKSFNGLIACYESSITKHIARNLCPIDIGEQSIDYRPAALKDLIYIVRLDLARDLAVKAVASDHAYCINGPPLKGIPPNDTPVNEMRQKVQNGFMVMSALSQIHKEVAAEFDKSSGKGPKRIKAERFEKSTSAQKAKEAELLRRWLDYTNPLAVGDMIDFVLTLWCIKGKTTFDHQAKGKKKPL